MFEFAGVNWWAVLVATAAAFLLGGLWYGPLFGQAWLDAIGKKKEELGSGSTGMTVSIFTSAATALLMALLVNTMGVVGFADGALLGLYVGVAFIAAGMASDYAFCGWGMKLFNIQAGYRIVYSVIMGGILGAWR